MAVPCSVPERSPSAPPLELDLRAELEEARRQDRQRVEIRRPVIPLIHVGGVRVGQVVDVEVHLRPGSAVPQNLAEAQIHGVQTIAVYRAGLDDLQELYGLSRTERPVQRGRVDDAGDVERECLCPEALALHGGELVAGILQAAERPADQHVDLRYCVAGEPLEVR